MSRIVMGFVEADVPDGERSRALGEEVTHKVLCVRYSAGNHSFVDEPATDEDLVNNQDAYFAYVLEKEKKVALGELSERTKARVDGEVERAQQRIEERKQKAEEEAQRLLEEKKERGESAQVEVNSLDVPGDDVPVLSAPKVDSQGVSAEKDDEMAERVKELPSANSDEGVFEGQSKE